MQDFLPMLPEELSGEPDIIIVTGDAYVDHPSFATALLGRYLQKHGYRVAVISQPDWRRTESFSVFGRPRLFFAVSPGNMDSMLNIYTNNRKPRSEDNYSPGGVPGKRPERAAIVYTQMIKKTYRNAFVVIGGIEASLRRFAHYDFWSDKMRRSILLDSKADLLVYGMGEKPLLSLARAAEAGDFAALEKTPQTMFRIGAKRKNEIGKDDILLPSYEEILREREKYCASLLKIHSLAGAFPGKRAAQFAGETAVVQNPPFPPLTAREMDEIYDLPFTRRPHPSYREKIPAFEMIKNSVTSHRGCFGGCSFCAIGAHQGKFVQSRSVNSIKKEIGKIAESGQAIVSDIGGPTANMYGMGGKDRKKCEKCPRISCLYPAVCPNLNTDHGPVMKMLEESLRVKGIRRIFVSSGIRMDLAVLSPEYIEKICRSHVSGQLKVAPEHVSAKVLKHMGKPPAKSFLEFARLFEKANRKYGKKQFLVCYFISSHPGCGPEEAAELGVFLKKRKLRPRQANDFIPTPMSLAGAYYWSGKNCLENEILYVPKGEKERKTQRAFLQYFKRENLPLIISALRKMGRKDLIPFFSGREKRRNGSS